MKEFGSRDSQVAVLLCEVMNCPVTKAAAPHPTDTAIRLATSHDQLDGHSSVLVYLDSNSKVSPEDALEALRLTGHRFPERIIAQS